MHNPFPGMNPYLEQPGLWPQVHNRLIVAIADDLTPQVAPKYRVSIEERVYTTTEPLPLVGIADVAVAQRQIDPNVAQTTAQLIEPRRVQVPLPVEVTERFLEVRLVQTNAVVCLIEVLSPSNKRPGDGRTAYETKRQKILGSATNLVEIDLLRSGSPMPLGDLERKPYSILVSRSAERPNAELYEFDLPEPSPSFPVPLQPDDPEPIVNLQRLINDLYSRARLDLAIGYAQPVKPELSEPDAAWVEAVLGR
ncbi:DUF4058 family protein [Nodosilinea nodulosa]|uniref:DUF4058 family protein n=1 Tax=Nodosilinea nodulosa TaxID=416001 RepID=UPI000474F62F|nr:DUF4058 family protein [Nodosilinea nodulosa]